MKGARVDSYRSSVTPMAIAALLIVASTASAQEAPPQYKRMLATLAKSGDYKDNVFKINIPRTDLRVTIDGRSATTPFGFGGWVALTPGGEGAEVLMGDLVVTEAEVNPVMSALLENGLDVTALHNHFFGEQPRIFYMHVHGRGTVEELSARLKPAISIIDKAVASGPAPSATPAFPQTLNTQAIATTVGQPGEQNGAVYKITIGRPDIKMTAHGATISSRMGLNTWAAFTGTDADAMVAGDVAMLEHELTPVLKALRSNGLNVVAIHHHMTEVQPVVVFLHYFGTGPAATLAKGVRAAVAQLGMASAAHVK